VSYIGNAPISAAFLVDTFSGTGSQTAFTMTVAPANTSSIIVAITGVLQDPSTYSVSGTTLTFSAAPPSGTSNISVRYLGIPASGVTTTAYRTVTDFTATAAQTSFSVPSYTVGYIDVYRNGVRLVSTDYTATTGTTVVLANACTSGDSVVTESFYVSSVLNAIPATAGSVSTSYLVDGSVTQAKFSTNVAGNGPAFRAYVLGSSYTGFSNSTWTKVALGGETFDTANCFDSTTNYRFTPTVAGYYQINTGVTTNWNGTQWLHFEVQIYKNGTGVVEAEENTATTNYPTVMLSDIIYLNGSSDYLELYVYASGGTLPTYAQGSLKTWMSGCLVRSA
jgi:hypothetical protein